jgi:tetratricopeptide (TPR) repeat protein
MIGLTIALAWGAVDWAGGRAPRLRALAAAGLASCAALGVVAWHQVGYWRSDMAVFRRAVAVTEHNDLAHHQIARSLFRIGDLEGATDEYERSLSIAPQNKTVHYEYAVLLAALDKTSQSQRHYALALEIAQAEGDAAFAAEVESHIAP